MVILFSSFFFFFFGGGGDKLEQMMKTIYIYIFKKNKLYYFNGVKAWKIKLTFVVIDTMM